MKRAAGIFMLGMMIFGLAATAAAGTTVRVRAEIPFAFYAGKELIPVGEYFFEIGSLNPAEASGSAILIHDQSGSITERLITMPGRPGMDSKVRLHFNQYRNQYFLTSVEGLGYQARLMKSKAEKELLTMGEHRLEMTLLVGK